MKQKHLITIPFGHASANPLDGETVYFGCMNATGITTTAAYRRVYVPCKCILRKIIFYEISTGDTGTNEDWVASIRKNNTTDYSIATVGVAGIRVFSNYLMSAPFDAGDYFEIKLVNPTWVTNPTGSICYGVALFEVC